MHFKSGKSEKSIKIRLHLKKKIKFSRKGNQNFLTVVKFKQEQILDILSSDIVFINSKDKRKIYFMISLSLNGFE